MGTKRKSVRLPEEIASELEETAKLPQYASEAKVMIAGLKMLFNVLRKGEPSAPAENLSPELDRALKEIERLEDVLRKDAECLSRYEDNNKLYCAKNAPKVVELSTEKICKACRYRLTKEALAKELPEIRYYYACGATERVEEKTGITWLFCKNPRCPKELRGQWHTTEHCKSIGCSLLKTVLIKKGKKKEE